MGPWRCSISMSCVIGALQIVLVLSLLHGASAQTSSNCSITTLSPLLPCLQYIENGNTTRPGSDCCTPLRAIITSSNPECICQIAPLAQTSGIQINQTRAIEVVAQCNQTLPASVASCLSGTATAPSGSTTPSPPPPPPTTSSSPGGTNDSSHGSTLLPPFFVLGGSIFVTLLVDLSMST